MIPSNTYLVSSAVIAPVISRFIVLVKIIIACITIAANIILLLFIFLLVAFLPSRFHIDRQGIVLYDKSEIIATRTGGLLQEIFIKTGDWVEEGQIVARPMMYLALSYDHRIIDGKEAVSFLKTIKECLEEPRRLFLDL